ncbi:ectoine hydroxylase-related dioxygenase (phytanoyl-CoA dioxygenase family) [Pedobacter sp. UYP24]
MATHKLPRLHTPLQVSEAQSTDFRRNGHIFIPGILQPHELSVYRKVICEAAERYNTEKRELNDRDTYGKAFLQIMNLWEMDAAVKQFTLAKRMAKIAADLMGVENVRIYHDQALFKEPGGGPTPWHQDQYYWPLDTMDTITMWMPLVDIDINMGMLTFATGSHTKGVVFDYEISDESEAGYEKYIKDNGFVLSRQDSVKAGDATFHYGNTIHSAPGNCSAQMREVMTVIYMADGGRVIEPKNIWQQKDRERWLMNTPVGELAASAINPKVL